MICVDRCLLVTLSTGHRSINSLKEYYNHASNKRQLTIQKQQLQGVTSTTSTVPSSQPTMSTSNNSAPTQSRDSGYVINGGTVNITNHYGTFDPNFHRNIHPLQESNSFYAPYQFQPYFTHNSYFPQSNQFPVIPPLANSMLPALPPELQLNNYEPPLKRHKTN